MSRNSFQESCVMSGTMMLAQVYAVALYVEADKAQTELQRLRAEGFFSKGYSDDRVMEALIQGRSELLHGQGACPCSCICLSRCS